MNKALPRVGVLHRPYGAATILDIARAARGRCSVVLLLRDSVARVNPELVRLSSRLFETHVVDDESTRAWDLALDGLTTFHDTELDMVDHQLRLLHLPGAPIDPENPWDKLVQRATLQRAGLSGLTAVHIDSPHDLRVAAEVLGLPFLLKPRRGNTSSGLAIISSVSDLRRQERQRLKWRGLLAEPFLGYEGRHTANVKLANFVSVESVVFAGEHRHVMVVDKLPPYFLPRAAPDGADILREVGDLAPSTLTRSRQDDLHRFVSECLRALGVTWRVTHTEVLVGREGFELVEVNGRVGGYMAQMVKAVGGPSLLEAALDVALGNRVEVPVARPEGWALVVLPVYTTVGSAQISPASAGALRAKAGCASLQLAAATEGIPTQVGDQALEMLIVGEELTEVGERLRQTLTAVEEAYAPGSVGVVGSLLPGHIN